MPKIVVTVIQEIERATARGKLCRSQNYRRGQYGKYGPAPSLNSVTPVANLYSIDSYYVINKFLVDGDGGAAFSQVVHQPGKEHAMQF